MAPANQTKERSVHELFTGHSRTKVQFVNRACFPKEKHQNIHKMGEIHELLSLALSLVWFAGATPPDLGGESLLTGNVKKKHCKTRGSRLLM